MLRQRNSKKQGDVGLAYAIAYYASQGFTVSLPLTDSQDYDLVVDNGRKLQRVQVKTTTYQRGACYEVNLRVSGGTRSQLTTTKFDATKADIVFVLCADGTQYAIPSRRTKAKALLKLGKKYAKFIVRSRGGMA